MCNCNCCCKFNQTFSSKTIIEDSGGLKEAKMLVAYYFCKVHNIEFPQYPETKETAYEMECAIGKYIERINELYYAGWSELMNSRIPEKGK